jgi:integrase/recombinase XerC
MFDERLSDFLQHLRFEKRYSPHTLIAYNRDIELFRDYLKKEYDISDARIVSHFHIRGWLAGMREDAATARTLNRKLSSISAFYRFLHKNGITDSNPVRKLHAQRLPERLPAALKESETHNLLEEIQFGAGFGGITDRLICELLYSTGMRRAELLQLSEQDIEWGLQQLRVLGKGNKERLLPLSAVMLDSLREYIDEKRKLEKYDGQFLLNLENGKPLYAGYVYRVVTRYLSGVTTMKKKSPHVLRHSFATHLLNNGANIQAIKDLLGHSSLAATQVYTSNSIEKLKQVHRQNHPRG